MFLIKNKTKEKRENLKTQKCTLVKIRHTNGVTAIRFRNSMEFGDGKLRGQAT